MLRNILENWVNILGTHWELNENTLGTTKIQHSPTLPQKGENKIKSTYKNRPIIYLGAKNSLSYYTL
jgi:hypothetical protein